MGMVGVDGPHATIDIIVVDLDRIGIGIRQGDHIAGAVEVIVVRAGVGVRRFDQADRLIHAGTVDVLAPQVIVAIVLGDALGPIVDVRERRQAIVVLPDPPAGRIVHVRQRLEPGRARRIVQPSPRPLDLIHPAGVVALRDAAILVRNSCGFAVALFSEKRPRDRRPDRVAEPVPQNNVLVPGKVQEQTRSAVVSVFAEADDEVLAIG